ncbi:MAG: LPS assembly protein LptD [Nitrospirota bacterium]|nr:LPS assembly protein LptD [Nitrospirota bacterium]MDH5768752.1 LPS assembly protein LptD [Nitrospirota bacterium]
MIKNSYQLSVISYQLRKTGCYLLIFISLFFFHFSLFTGYCFAEEQITVTSESLEYEEETSTYIAKGSVKVKKGEMSIESDEMRYNEQTSDAIMIGNVRYNDKDMSFTASRAELNLEIKTGRLYETAIFFKKDNYHISGKEVEKRGEGYYFSPEATFTTCDGPLPAWCFKGKEVNAVVGERLKAKDVSFHINDIPVLYAPYLWAPILAERQTGFLTPGIGYSKSRGAHLNIPFFWAMSENRDMTFVMDMYSKRGIGEGLEYRYVEAGDIKGNAWLYHIRDTELNKDIYEFKAVHEQRSTEGIGGFLNINYVNEKDFYREFSLLRENRTYRFLESDGEISLPLPNSRAYLLSQYWVDLKETTKPTQKLPEAGYVLNPTKIGNFWFSTIATVSNFWRDQGVSGQRLDIYPKISHTFGSDFVVTQDLALRETAYSLRDNEETGNSPHREALEYNFITHTRLIKKYESFTHIIEPSIEYHLITNSENNLPVFDSTELFKKTSRIELALLNRFLDNSGEIMVMRVSQGFDSFYDGDRPFLPLKLELGVKKPIPLRLDTSYDVNTGKVESVNSDMWIKVSDVLIGAMQRYNRQEDITFFGAGFGLQPFKSLHTEVRFFYDGREKQITDTTINLRYISQCWGVNMVFVKKPHDFTFAVMFELKGFGSRRFFRT